MADQEKGRQEERSNHDEAAGKESLNSVTQGKSMTTERGMGTVGGGNIPGSKGSGTTQGGVSTSSGDGSSEGSAERGSVKDSSEENEPTATNTMDNQEQSSGGGRNPSQPQTAMGDQDATQGRAGDQVTEPMSSRAPDKINQKQK